MVTSATALMTTSFSGFPSSLLLTNCLDLACEYKRHILLSPSKPTFQAVFS